MKGIGRKMEGMNLESILAEYDAMFGRKSLEEIEEFLVFQIAQSREHSRQDIEITLLNEIIGFCRDTTQKDKALQYCRELLELLEKMGLEGTVPYATSLLNVANAYRAFGLFEEGLRFFEIVQEIYQRNLTPNDFNYASLYNNWSLLYQEMQQYGNAVRMLERALKVVDSYENAVIPQATTRTNLAVTLLQLGTEEAYEQAMQYLREALKTFEADGGRDFHYGAALVAMGDACNFKKEFAEAAKYYEAGLREIEKHTGKNDNYERVAEKLRYAKACGRNAKACGRNAKVCGRNAKVCGRNTKAEESFSEGLEFAEGTQFIEKRATGSKTIESRDKWKSNLERCREFFEKYGLPMLRDEFPEYMERIAVGMVGEGSDCFGFEDEISTDHDFGLGFCMWLTEADYREIGERLQAVYERMMQEFAPTGSEERFLQNRRGVFSINGFYGNLLGVALDYETGCLKQEDVYQKLMESVEEFQLAQAVNGEVFRDSFGVFTDVRENLSRYYPEAVWRNRLARAMHEFSQYAQSNYARMMARGDLLTALICVGKACEAAMDLAYLLEREYAPYYKWKRKGLEKIAEKSDCVVTREIFPLLEEIAIVTPQQAAWLGVSYSSFSLNEKDAYVLLFEKLAEVVLEGLKQRGLVQLRRMPGGENAVDVFLEGYIPQILQMEFVGGRNAEPNVKAETMGAKSRKGEERQEGTENVRALLQGVDKMDIVEKIVELEWKQFDKVKNEGGRADCQDNWGTFSIMRKSQYLAWPEELLVSFNNDLLAAEEKGWNLIMEKYARMMKSTAPKQYAELEKELPVLSEERLLIQEEIIKIQVTWMEEFAEKYPKMAGNARSIHTTEDNAYNTSYETYLRGEISTYSEETFVIYGRFVVELVQQGRNLAYEIMENTAKLYGYDSVEDAERVLS